ncbi:Sodium-independent sulfate anion transporter [Pseudolycoriella hygida]|uniref:Sodium-independent sulfate anion transporter n=1 Tax=Pseudolycoriella hygida TaxID=35572 RepID=A0A9Q0RYN3_9DIPT|nr:Sodium-independent sulfate anion transporter [Pseudolycoriella hygida]
MSSVTRSLLSHLHGVYVLENETELQRLRALDDAEERPVKSINIQTSVNWRGQIKKRIFILSWIKNYDKDAALGDFIAGITLGLTMIPQAIAYAALADMPSEYGLYSAFMGSLIYVFFGTIKEVSIGPTSLMSLLTLQYTLDKPPQYAIVLTFLAGCIELLMGVLKLGFVVDFISVPVTNAFTSATSVIIIGAQLKNLLGLSYSSKGFADSLHHLIFNISDIKLWDSVSGLVCCVFLLSLRFLKDIKMKSETKCTKISTKFLWYLSQARNVLIVIITSSVAYHWTLGTVPFTLSGKVQPGIPSFSLPPFQFEYNNQTIGFVQICTELGSGIVVVPLVAVLANIAIAKAFSTGAAVDASQEMFILGVCNILGSFVSSMPTCGAFTRSAVSHASGVRTPFSGIYSATIALLALTLLTPYFYFIPKSTLAAVLIIAVVFMIDFKLPLHLWRNTKRDFWTWCGCFVVCLIAGVAVGLLFGVMLNVLHLLYMWARPETTLKIEEIENMQYIKVAPNIGMFFPGIDHLKQMVNKALSAADFKVPVVIDCTKFTGLDYTAAQGVCDLAEELHKQRQVLVLQNLDTNLQSFIASENVLFCSKEETLKEIITQECIRSGSISLMAHIRASIDLGYKVEPLIDSTNIEIEN